METSCFSQASVVSTVFSWPVLGQEFICLSLSNSLLLHLCCLFSIPPTLSPFSTLPICSFRLFHYIIYLVRPLVWYLKTSLLCLEFSLFFVFRMYENCNKPLCKYLYGELLCRIQLQSNVQNAYLRAVDLPGKDSWRIGFS